MENGGVDLSNRPPDSFARESLCFSGPEPGLVIHNGDPKHHEQQQELFAHDESRAIENLIKLKARLRNLAGSDFWEQMTEGLAKMMGAQYAFVSKRIVTDDENAAVEMPPIGMPGSCLMGLAIYISDGLAMENRMTNFKYHAYSCPCAYMRHDKVFVIAKHLEEFVVGNPNVLPLPAESYIGIPLFAHGKCIGHFGVMWGPKESHKRGLGWAHMELLLHSVEDMILNRMLEKRDFSENVVDAMKCGHSKVIPHDAIATATQSLKPYARSLSHELRTPMQGVVGMLDVMYATVQDAVQEHRDLRVRKVFTDLKKNIEDIQDSSRRAVEAADNVVHAYDMNMGVPETPATPFDDDEPRSAVLNLPEKRPDIVVAGNNMHLNLKSNKRKREPTSWDFGPAPKVRVPVSPQSSRGRNSFDTQYAASLAEDVSASRQSHHDDAEAYTSPKSEPRSPVFATERNIVPGLRHTNLPDVLQYIINDSLKIGGRPESAIAKETENGEIIEVHTRSPAGEDKVKIIEWSVANNVPDSMLIDERELGKMISCVVLNAIKFTEEGKITITARLSHRNRYIIINVKDSGPGIPTAFHPNLFKAFSREDDSLTRQSEGLGLGLLVAKGLARKLGGDIRCVHTETYGPDKGSDFEMRVPLTPSDVCSRPCSPSGSMSPATRSRTRTPGDSDERLQTPALPPTTTKVLTDLIHESRNDSHHPNPSQTSTSSPSLLRSPRIPASPSRRPSAPQMSRRLSTKSTSGGSLAKRHPLNFLVAEDNKINRSILVSMLKKLGYSSIKEAYDGADAVRKMTEDTQNGRHVDVILMDLWMPFMDGYEATERILEMGNGPKDPKPPTILAVTADVTDGALERAARAGMKGFMTKPYKLTDLERLIVEYCAQQTNTDTT
ncbi:hypothetical protein EJ05DRAFT_437930 [Pseudovirgaria hyperparasitica]|uniref:histidine kinase n=1 Tax=Pseudovirgaria hyperparasitica TaxID=470096 RepID=A0A6A6W9N2_9PEZI|nr:uncharacterized protein EJ05DRAFT_437930 [Pseudovirgaria hyperparasitica]KAF2759383.1 hypothetical protein EJ05DRAFT_437930 [Pseudovirgaria hyperparasitica]